MQDSQELDSQPGADLGGGGADASFSLRIRPPSTQRVPLCTILRNPYLVEDPKNFLKTPSAPIYSNFEGGARQKTRFFGQHFPKNA